MAGQREVTTSILNHTGLTFDKNLICQKRQVNFVNGSNLFKEDKQPQSLAKLAFTYPALIETPGNAYIDSLTSLNTNKMNLKSNIISSFSPLENAPHTFTDALSALGISLNNPYLISEATTHAKQKEADKNAYIDNNDNAFLLLLNDLKHLYTGPSFTDRTNKSRMKKIDLLIDWFSKFNNENELKLDEKNCLVYRNLQTNVKFSVYVDYFIKYPQELRSKSVPMYFQELFLDKILKSQVKFTPTVQYLSGKIMRKHRKKKRQTLHRSSITSRYSKMSKTGYDKIR